MVSERIGDMKSPQITASVGWKSNESSFASKFVVGIDKAGVAIG
jgi:hypothetical protein